MSCIYVDSQYSKCMGVPRERLKKYRTTIYSESSLRWRCSGQNEEFTMYINGQDSSNFGKIR